MDVSFEKFLMSIWWSPVEQRQINYRRRINLSNVQIITMLSETLLLIITSFRYGHPQVKSWMLENISAHWYYHFMTSDFSRFINSLYNHVSFRYKLSCLRTTSSTQKVLDLLERGLSWWLDLLKTSLKLLSSSTSVYFTFLFLYQN